MSTILLPHVMNVAEHLYLRIVTLPLSVAAEPESTQLLVVVGGLVLLLLVALVLFRRISRKPHAAPPVPAEKAGEPPAQIVVPPPPQPATVSLEFTAESEQRINFTLDKPTLTIGRAPDNDIVVAAPVLNVDTVSQHHARLRRDPDGYVLRDLNSKNGLAVNGRQTIENLLQDGDRLQFGEAEAIFHQPAGGAA